MPAKAESPLPDQMALALGTRVLTEREARGMTKEALAATSGLASRYIWRLEAGRQNVQFQTLAAIAKGLGLTLSALLAGVEEEAANPTPRPAVKPRGVKGQRSKTA